MLWLWNVLYSKVKDLNAKMGIKNDFAIFSAILEQEFEFYNILSKESFDNLIFHSFLYEIFF